MAKRQTSLDRLAEDEELRRRRKKGRIVFTDASGQETVWTEEEIDQIGTPPVQEKLQRTREGLQRLPPKTYPEAVREGWTEQGTPESRRIRETLDFMSGKQTSPPPRLVPPRGADTRHPRRGPSV